MVLWLRGMLWISLVPMALSNWAPLALGQNQNGLTMRDREQQAFQQYRAGNYRDALPLFRSLAAEPKMASSEYSLYLQRIHECLQNSASTDSYDAIVASIIQTQPDNMGLHIAAAAYQLHLPGYGVVGDGKFYRSPSQPIAGTSVDREWQDRHLGLFWLAKFIPAKDFDLPDQKQEVAELYGTTFQLLLAQNTQQSSWRLQRATDLQVAPDYLDLDAEVMDVARHAPVLADGKPLLYKTPPTWREATSDGERIRWLLAEIQELDPDMADVLTLDWADSLNEQFSVDTLLENRWLQRRLQDTEDSTQATTGIFDVHTLSDEETIAHLANGIQRFRLPDEHNPLYLYKRLAQSSNESISESAAKDLFQIYVNRRQLTKAVAWWKQQKSLAAEQDMLLDIIEPRGKLDATGTFPAGKKASLGLVFRNAHNVQFQAMKVDVEKLVQATKEWLMSKGDSKSPFAEDRLPDIPMPAEQFSKLALGQFATEEAANWSVPLEPKPGHWDQRIQVETPLQEPGLYIVTAQFDEGQSLTRCMFWIQDTVIAHTGAKDSDLYYVADANSGAPLAGVNLEFLGYKHKTDRSKRPEYDVKNFAKKTDAKGFVRLQPTEWDPYYQWTVIARDGKKRLAIDNTDIMGFPSEKQLYREVKAFGISDRPVYRPGDDVHAKLWLAAPSYDPAIPGTPLRKQQFTANLLDAQGTVVSTETFTTDEFGGAEWNFSTNKGLRLGSYQLAISYRSAAGQDQACQCNLRFLLEEYRKPEFEVTVESPKKPVALGETIRATIKAKYYFGAPVTEAQVKVRVERSAFQDSYFPVTPYDWCYGRGYWWIGSDYSWYPGWSNWRCFTSPQPPWMPWAWRSSEPPEVVFEQDLQLDASGECPIAIDTAVAKAFQSDQDHRYSIHVEVRDASRRTITADGSVLAMRKPFQVYAWTDCHYYQVGQKIKASIQSRSAAEVLPGMRGTLQLLRLRFDQQDQPSETLIQEWPITTDEAGMAVQELSAADGGQYRLKVVLEKDGQRVEAGHLVVVRGKGEQSKDFRFSGLELIPDQMTYRVGDTVRLLVQANRPDATVLLSIRSENGFYPEPQIIQLEGKSKVIDIPLAVGDQPNLFVEALTIYDGKVFEATREIFVPPEDKALIVKTRFDRDDYQPGEKARATIQVQDPAGKGVRASVAVAVFDRSLESFGERSEDILAYFWKWRRSLQQPRWQVENLKLYTEPLWIEDLETRSWTPLGIFGYEMTDEDFGNWEDSRFRLGMGTGGGGMGGGGMGGMRSMRALAVESAPSLGGKPSMVVMADGSGAGVPNGGDGMTNATPVTIRSDFADTALWMGNVITKEDGTAELTFTMPDNIASWRVASWAVGSQVRVGSDATTSVTRKHLMARLQLPRFLVQGDRSLLSAILNNETDDVMETSVTLEIEGETQLQLSNKATQTQKVSIPARGQQRLDWECLGVAEGEAKVTVIARSQNDSDAMVLPLPVLVRGMQKTESLAGTLRFDQSETSVAFTTPAQRRAEKSQLTVRLSPSLAASMIDALPFLVEYPHGCTEQTLNRFVPLVVTQRILQEMKVDLAALAKSQANLNAQELGNAVERRQLLGKGVRNPVFDEAEVRQRAEAGLQRLTEMQNSDGGWGWFSGARETSWPHTTVTVVRGLIVARQNDSAIVPGVLERGLTWLKNYQKLQLQKLRNAVSKTEPYKSNVDNLDALVFQTLVGEGRIDTEMQTRLFEQRLVLSPYGKALLGLATHAIGNLKQTEQLRKNIEERLIQDASNETAYLEPTDTWWYWYDSDIEAMATYLQLLTKVDAKGVVAPRIVKYLLNHRRHGSYWNSTRDTALVLEAFADYLRATGETTKSSRVEVFLDDLKIGSVDFTPETLFSVNNTIAIHGDAIRSGDHRLTIKRAGDGNLYWNAYLSNFTMEEEIEAAGSEVQVSRSYSLLTPIQKEVVMAGERGELGAGKQASFQRKPISDLGQVPSGSLVEVELQVTSKNAYEYLLIEDPKLASMEPIDVRSGYDWTGDLSVYREFRDQRVLFYLRELPQGSHRLTYRVRTEAPGQYAGMPTVIQGMYAPELVGNAKDFDLKVIEAR